MVETAVAAAPAPVAPTASLTRLPNERPADLQTWHEMVHLLHREARMIDEELFDEWMQTVAHAEICYQVFNKQLRMRRDRRFTGAERAYAWNDSLEDIQTKIVAWQSGMQWSADPKERLRHHIGNVEVYEGERAGELTVYANCWVVRNRRVYEEMTFSYGRRDVWQRQGDGTFKLLKRECDVDQRFIHGKNLAFFL